MKTLQITLSDGTLIDFFGSTKQELNFAILEGLKSPYGVGIAEMLSVRANKKAEQLKAKRKQRKAARKRYKNARKCSFRG